MCPLPTTDIPNVPPAQVCYHPNNSIVLHWKGDITPDVIKFISLFFFWRLTRWPFEILFKNVLPNPRLGEKGELAAGVQYTSQVVR